MENKNNQDNLARSLINTFESSLTNTFEKSELQQTAIDFMEVGVDTLIPDEILKEVPIVSTIYAIGKTTLSIKDRLFLKKIWIYLTELQVVSEEDRKSFVKQLNSREAQKLGEKILLLLEKHEDFHKAKLLAKITSSYISKEISKPEFDNLCYALDKLFIDDIELLQALDRGEQIEQDRLQCLFLSGLVSLDIGEILVSTTKAPVSYVISQLGKLFVQVVRV